MYTKMELGDEEAALNREERSEELYRKRSWGVT